MLGIDEQGREVLTYLPGETVGATHPWPSWAWSEEMLVQAGPFVAPVPRGGHLVSPSRRDAVANGDGGLAPGEVICHNDWAPYDAVWQDGLIGMIDWDFAAPNRPEWDLAFAAWQFVPFHEPAPDEPLSDVVGRAGDRLRLLLDAYGLADRAGFLDLVIARIESSIRGIRSLAQQNAAFARMLAEGHADAMIDARDRIIKNHAALQKGLD